MGFTRSVGKRCGTRWAHGGTAKWLLLALALSVLLAASPGLTDEWTDSVSREITINLAADPTPGAFLDAVSREITINLAADPTPDAFLDAVSREITINLASDPTPGAFLDAVSREITINLAADPTQGAFLDAVSREISILNAYEFGDAISRELSVLTEPLAKAKLQPDDEMVTLQGQDCVVVTAAFEDCIYIEATDRSAGIKVVGQTAIPGKQIRLTGMLKTADTGERYIEADSLTATGDWPLRPLGVLARSLYCGGYQFDPEQEIGQPGVTDGSGVSLVGLYVRLAGTALSASASEMQFDDGTGKPIKVLLPANAQPVVPGSIVKVSGVLTLEKVGESLSPLIRATSIE